MSPPPPMLLMTIMIDSRAKRGYCKVVEPEARLSNEPEASETVNSTERSEGDDTIHYC